MRTLILAFAAGIVLAASAHAAPPAPQSKAIELGTAPPVELVGGGCGFGWHRNYWKDRWGNLRKGRCVKDWWR